jgi:hypothetical protein
MFAVGDRVTWNEMTGTVTRTGVFRLSMSQSITVEFDRLPDQLKPVERLFIGEDCNQLVKS